MIFKFYGVGSNFTLELASVVLPEGVMRHAFDIGDPKGLREGTGYELFLVIEWTVRQRTREMTNMH